MIPPSPQDKSKVVLTRKRVDPLARFWPRVQANENGCWLWLGQQKPNGYSAFWSGERKVYAHRFAYELLIAPIPPGLDIDHLCRNRGCVNPRHLEPVTRGVNLRRGLHPNMIVAATGFCKRGHRMEGENVARNGKYHCCRACKELMRSKR